MASAEEKFRAAVNAIKKLPKDGPFQPSYEMMKRFYGLYKQATEGPCNEPRPAFWNAIKKAKWEAWSCLGDMGQLEAQEQYVTEMLKVMVVNFKAKDVNHVVQIVEAMPQTEEVRNFLEVMGPFFELVKTPEEGKTPNGGIPNGDVPHLPNGDAHGIEEDDPSQVTPQVNEETDLEQITVGGPDVSHIPNGHVTNQDVEDMENIEESTATTEMSDLSHPIYASEEQSRGRSNSEESNSTSSEDEFLDSFDQPDVSVERRVRFADTEPLATVMESQPLTSSPVACERITTEVEIHNIPGNHQRTNYSVQKSLPAKSHSRGAGDGVYSSEVTTENIPLILERLQRDMNSVIARLNNLETNTLTQGAEDSPDWPVRERKGGSWWPFGGLNGPTVFFIILWPFIVHWALRYLSRRRFPKS